MVHGCTAGGWALATGLPLATALAIVALAPMFARVPALGRLERALTERVSRVHTPRTIAVFADLSALGSSTLVAVGAVVAALLLQAGGDRDAALAVLVAPAVGGPFGTLLKRLTHRTRPDQPAGVYFGSSMPSNHTLMATALYGTLGLELRGVLPAGADALAGVVQAIVVAVVAGVGVSRVLLRVHHLSDVLAGWALGAAVVAAVALKPWSC